MIELDYVYGRVIQHCLHRRQRAYAWDGYIIIQSKGQSKSSMDGYSNVGILDLPDEILLFILSKLKNVDVLYSLMDINERLDKIAYDPILTRSIDLVTISSNCESNSLTHLMFDRLCHDILPRIHQNVKCLTLEPSSIECIFRAGDYPNLHKLNLVTLEREQALHYFNGT